MNRVPVTIVGCTRTRDEIVRAAQMGADIIEIRLDLCTSPFLEPRMLEGLALPPLILTLRSRAEGGLFGGDPVEWRKSLNPWLDRATYIDVELRYSQYAGDFRSRGKKVIASWHAPYMLTAEGLQDAERSLRSFGDIPKIVVLPDSLADILTLLSFTLGAEKPISTGIGGSRFRWGRILLPVFGSQLVYCHAGNPTAEGQYSIQEFRKLLENFLR